MSDPEAEEKEVGKKITRAGMEIIGGAIPFVGGFLSAAATAWGEKDQEKVNDFFKSWLQMLADEVNEKGKTIAEIVARLDIHDSQTEERVKSKEYQSLLKKAFREWPAAENEEKRKRVRNILANAAAASIVTDDVVTLFLDWLKTYSELHFQVISVIYNSGGISRGEIWRRLGKDEVRENSAEADLFKLLIQDLSMGHVIRQHRETDYEGNFVLQNRSGQKRVPSGGTRIAKSAFSEEDQYELTELGDQFVHYAMNDLSLKIEAPSDGSFG